MHTQSLSPQSSFTLAILDGDLVQVQKTLPEMIDSLSELGLEEKKAKTIQLLHEGLILTLSLVNSRENISDETKRQILEWLLVYLVGNIESETIKAIFTSKNTNGSSSILSGLIYSGSEWPIEALLNILQRYPRAPVLLLPILNSIEDAGLIWQGNPTYFVESLVREHPQFEQRANRVGLTSSPPFPNDFKTFVDDLCTMKWDNITPRSNYKTPYSTELFEKLRNMMQSPPSLPPQRNRVEVLLRLLTFFNSNPQNVSENLKRQWITDLKALLISGLINPTLEETQLHALWQNQGLQYFLTQTETSEDREYERRRDSFWSNLKDGFRDASENPGQRPRPLYSEACQPLLHALSATARQMAHRDGFSSFISFFIPSFRPKTASVFTGICTSTPAARVAAEDLEVSDSKEP